MKFNLVKKIFILLLVVFQVKTLQAEINVFLESKHIVKENLNIDILKLKHWFLNTSIDVAVSNPGLKLFNENGKAVNELDGISYNYMNVLGSIGAARIISFELNKEASKKYAIKDLSFMTPDNVKFISNLAGVATGEQKAKNKNENDAFSFGSLKKNSLENTVAQYYKNNNWYYIIAKLCLFNKEIKKDEFYIIRLNPKAYNDFSKKVHTVYKTNSAINFKIPVE